MATAGAGGGSNVLRFTGTERALHWGFAAGYLALLATGLLLMLPPLRASIRGYTPVVGLRLHLALAVLWVLATAGVAAVGDRRRLAQTRHDLSRWGREDRLWLRRFPRWLVGGAGERAVIDGAVGRFNAGQKLNAIFTVLTAVGLLVTGLLLWPLGATGLPAAVWLTGPGSVGSWRAAHRWLTLLALAPLAGHVFLAVGHPATRPSLRGILKGHVDRAWAEAHHPRWPAEDVNRTREAA